jgi:hypothetical protein
MLTNLSEPNMASLAVTIARKVVESPEMVVIASDKAEYANTTLSLVPYVVKKNAVIMLGSSILPESANFLRENKPQRVLLVSRDFTSADVDDALDAVNPIPPTVSVTSPATNSIVRGQVPIEVTASDNVAVQRVDFYIDNSLISSVTNEPYTYTLDTLTQADGSHNITAKAYDRVGNTAEFGITITIDNTQPSISDVALFPSAPTIHDTITFRADITDVTTGVATVILNHTTDGTTWQSLNMTLTEGNTYEATIGPLASETKLQYYVKATDTAGNIATSAIQSITIPTPPTEFPLVWLVAFTAVIAVIIATTVFFIKKRRRSEFRGS